MYTYTTYACTFAGNNLIFGSLAQQVATVLTAVSPGFFIRLKTVVLRDPRVDLDAASLLLPQKSGHEGPGHLEWVRCIHHRNKNLGN